MTGLQKQNTNISFVKGLETKTDPKQIPAGNFLSLKNVVFDTTGLLHKKNGAKVLTTVTNASTITTYNDGLVALGTALNSISSTNQTTNAGAIQPLSLSTKSLVRSATSQTNVDTAVNSDGLACSVWLDSDANCYYQISDSLTGQTVVPKVQLPSTSVFARVNILGSYFIITFLATVAAATHLQYIAIPIVNPASPLAAADISTQVNTLSAGYDAITYDNNLYVSWVSNVSSNAVKATLLTNTLVQGSTVTVTGETGNLISITCDSSSVWISIYKSSANTIRSTTYNLQLSGATLAPTTVVSSITINELTSVSNGTLTIFYEVANTYSYSPNAKSDYISKNTLTLPGVVGTPAIVLRSVGLSSKAGYIGTTAYMLACYGGTYQPTYFLIDSSGNVISKLAYSNGGGYSVNQVLAGVNISDSTLKVGYLFKDLLAAVNKTQGIANIAGIYSQTGINLASFELNNSVNTVETGNNLHISGGFLWMYDGVKAVEHGFHLWPEDITTVPTTTGGHLIDQTYYYQVTYEWTDNQGNIHRSAPSVPIVAVVSGGGGSGKVTLNIPTLRLTYKTSNKVRIVIYRWSTAQQSYYRTTSITSPTLNDPTTDSITYIDTLADATILGNDLIYTTGGVIENIAAPACSAMALYGDRVFLIDAEDPNLLWYSKVILQNTPAEFSDLFTIYVSPTTGAQGSTGESKALSAMDDKLIIAKKDAFYYLTGKGPDATGANNDFSSPVYISSTVGTDNPDSIVFIPQGLMVQSDKGIWLLARDLSTQYIGSPVQAFNNYRVLSAQTIPGTNQVRFKLENNITLMYDYFQQQWVEFSNSGAISSTLYQGLETYLNDSGQIYQETPDLYFDGNIPVLISFLTGWFNLAGLQGYQRAYYFYMLAEFLSPHKIQIQISYDYAPAPQQSMIITPDNYSNLYGGDEVYGETSPYGGPGDLEQWRIFFQQQKCQAFQISLSEVYDNSYAPSDNKGLTISGLNLVYGLKKGFRPIYSKNSVG